VDSADDRLRSHQLLLIAILVVALLVRLGWALSRSTDPRSLTNLPDQLEYLELGQNLRDGRGLVFHDPRFGQDVRAYRTPGYPFLVAVCGGNLCAIRLVQALLDTSTVLAAYVLARHWLSPRRSCFAAAIVAANPFLMFFISLILSETLFIAMLAWGIALLPRRWIAGAIILALSLLVRPSALLLPTLLAAGSALLNRRRGGTYHFATLALRAGVAVLMTVLSLFPWALRNRSVLGEWVWTTTNGGITAYDGFNPGAISNWGGSHQDFVSQMPELRDMSETARSRYLSAKARAWAAAHPLAVARLASMKIARTWSLVPLSAEYGGQRLYVLVGLFYSLPLDALVIAGLITGRALPGPVKLLLLLPALYFTAVHAASVGSLRYRIPAEVPISVIGASAFMRRHPADTNHPVTASPMPASAA
jgi:hypothetical protein